MKSEHRNTSRSSLAVFKRNSRVAILVDVRMINVIGQRFIRLVRIVGGEMRFWMTLPVIGEDTHSNRVNVMPLLFIIPSMWMIKCVTDCNKVPNLPRKVWTFNVHDIVLGIDSEDLKFGSQFRLMLNAKLVKVPMQSPGFLTYFAVLQRSIHASHVPRHLCASKNSPLFSACTNVTSSSV